MTSTITLYKGCNVIEGKNYVVDDISAYLGTLESTEFTNCQFIKPSLNLDIKLQLSQDMIAKNIDFADNYNYVSIKDNVDNAKTYYYFIEKLEWKSANAIQLQLKEDTLNTWQVGADFELSPKTKIERSHGARYEANNTATYDTYKTGVFSQYTQLEDKTYTASVKVQQDELVGVDEDNITFTFKITGTTLSRKVNFTSSTGTVEAIIRCGTTTARPYLLRITVYDKTYKRYIDLVPEGINPTLYHNDNDDVTLKEKFDTSWNLVYRSTPESTVTAVSCFLYPDTAATIKVHGGINEITPAGLVSGRYYYLWKKPDDSTSVSYEIFNNETGARLGWITDSGTYSSAVTMPNFTRALMYVDTDGKITIKFTTASSTYDSSRRLVNTTYTVFTYSGLTSIRLNSNSNITYSYSSSSTTDITSLSALDALSTGTFQQQEYVTKNLLSIDSVVRSDSDLVKIIKVPYCPIGLTTDDDGNVILDGVAWTYNTQYSCIQLNDLNTKFDKQVDFTSQFNPYSPLITDTSWAPALTDLRDDAYESKLYHSDYYLPKFTYDSFGFPFALEKVDINKVYETQKFTVDYRVSSTINSRFCFMFPEYVLEHSSEDYSNVLNIARNNEMTIYNSEYLNYIKTGYNYDVKNENIKIGSSIATSLLTTLGGAIIGGMKGSAIGPAGTIAGAAVGLAAGLISTVTDVASAENTISQKLDTYRNQATSVQDANDIDLLEAYSENRAKCELYQCSSTIKKGLGDLFFYCGYKVGYQGLPDLKSRSWFNFLQADIDLLAPKNMSSEAIEDIKSKFSEGVTVFHHNLINDAITWDWDQKYENWETAIL